MTAATAARKGSVYELVGTGRDAVSRDAVGRDSEGSRMVGRQSSNYQVGKISYSRAYSSLSSEICNVKAKAAALQLHDTGDLAKLLNT
jgi:hypothetical protein